LESSQFLKTNFSINERIQTGPSNHLSFEQHPS
jgi:hypothetical protein